MRSTGDLSNNNNNIFILYSAKSIYSSKRFKKMYKIASVKLIRNVTFVINIQVKNYATCS